METAIGIGSLVGGFMLGAVASRPPKGKLIIGAYIAFGLGAMAVGLVDSIPLVLGLFFGIGGGQHGVRDPEPDAVPGARTPPELMGRVVSLRFALVFGGMSLAMALAGVAMTAVGAGPVIFAAGIVSIIAGVAGLFVRAVRDA